MVTNTFIEKRKLFFLNKGDLKKPSVAVGANVSGRALEGLQTQVGNMAFGSAQPGIYLLKCPDLSSGMQVNASLEVSLNARDKARLFFTEMERSA